jgi:hypothetical protein
VPASFSLTGNQGSSELASPRTRLQTAGVAGVSVEYGDLAAMYRDPNDPLGGAAAAAIEAAAAAAAVASAGYFRLEHRATGVVLPPTVAPRRHYMLTLRAGRPDLYSSGVPLVDSNIDQALYAQLVSAPMQKPAEAELSFFERVRAQRVVRQASRRHTVRRWSDLI